MGDKKEGQSLCDTCHWSAHEQKIVLTDGTEHIYGCHNIGVPGWEYYEKNQKAPEECADYCLEGTYYPTGIWADVARAVRKAQEAVDEDGEGI